MGSNDGTAVSMLTMINASDGSLANEGIIIESLQVNPGDSFNSTFAAITWTPTGAIAGGVFGGERVALRAVYTIPCKFGDFDADGDVDGSDLAVFAADLGRTDCAIEPPCEGDFDGDNDLDGSDRAVFAADFGRTDCPDTPENSSILQINDLKKRILILKSEIEEKDEEIMRLREERRLF